MNRPPRYKSIVGPIVLFWIFSSIPRLWFNFLEHSFSDQVSLAMATLIAGFLADGLTAGILFIPAHLSDQWLRQRSERAATVLHRCLVLFFTASLALEMANTEYLRFFGGNVNLTHLAFLSDSAALVPSLLDIFPPWKLAVDLVIVPGLYLLGCRYLPWWRFDFATKRRGSIVGASVVIVIGFATPRVWPVTEPVWKSVSRNYFFTLVRRAIKGDELIGRSDGDIAAILDPLPLPDPRVGSQPWYFISPKRYPLAKASAYDMCRLGLWDAQRCAVDNDGDGYPLKDDCNDWDPRIHPGATDIPGDGIDQDCSGMDADPPNVLFIHWEGVRAVDVGSIGYHEAATPHFDVWARKGILFRNAYANGTQTRWSLTSIYNSILPRLSNEWIFKHNPDLNLQAWPQILRNYGYETLYIHGGDVNFGNFRPRFWEWFDVILDRTNTPELEAFPKVGWGVRDKDLFHFVYDYLSKRKDTRPFCLCVQTLSVHHPFILPDPKYAMEDHQSLKNQVPNVIRYSDAALGEFLDKFMKDPRFKNTIVVISADHGLNWFSPHSASTHSVLWEDLVWVPVLLIGNWGRPPGVVDEVRQLADIGPTILDRLGIEIPNHFIGHSLLRRFGKREARAYFGNADSGLTAGLRVEDDKYFYNYMTGLSRFFDMKTDRGETQNLAGTPAVKSRQEKYRKLLTRLYSENGRLIRDNRIWNWKWSLDGKDGSAARAKFVAHEENP